jgi:hypothetical protein
VSTAVIAALCEDLVLFPPAESLWLAIADRLTHPPPPLTPEIDSQIVDKISPLFEEFRVNISNCCGGAAATVSPLMNSTSTAMAARTL